jgi:hypothetical protein
MDLPSYDYERYKWRPSNEDTKSYHRYAAGAEKYEDFLNRYVDGQHTIYTGYTTSLATSTQSSQVLRAARQAWAVLRFNIPAPASATEQDKDDDALLTYRAAADADVVRAWVERVVTIHEAVDLVTARVDIGKEMKLPDDKGQPTFLFVVPVNHSTTEYGFLFLTYHTPFDGMGCHAVMDQFFSLFAYFLHS